MEQRRLRLGDILDDYCPRERRVTNHAIVAMIEDDIKQTRCTTCDAEHAYKGAKVPRRRPKDTPALVAPAAGVPLAVDAGDHGDEEPADVTFAEEDAAPAFEPEPAEVAAEPRAADEGEEPPDPVIDDGPVHRPLIRAQLPRPEGQKTERPLPDFTMRHANGRGGNHAFRGNGRPKMRAQGGGNGNRAHGRFQGQGRGGPHGGFRSGPPRHGGKKRSR